jgi:hypothetical protein
MRSFAVQTCSICHAQSPDPAVLCFSCHSDLREYSTTAMALKRFQSNPRVSMVRISVSANACPVCQQAQGAYPKAKTPRLPIEGCSNGPGCQCYYEPVLTEIYP